MFCDLALITNTHLLMPLSIKIKTFQCTPLLNQLKVMEKPYARSFRPSRNLIIYNTHLLTWKPKGAHQQNVHLDMREAMKTYARSPVHSLCASCPSPPKDRLTKTANLETQRGKSSQKHPGDMQEATKTYARRTVHSLCFSPPRNHLTKLLPWRPKGTHQAKIVLESIKV